VPVTFLVLRNDEYAILKWFGMLEDIVDAPGLDLPALDCAAVGSGYGVNSRVVDGADKLGDALSKALASDKPELVEVKVAPGMALL
jgi:benzoylformate decarboxylase